MEREENAMGPVDVMMSDDQCQSKWEMGKSKQT
jgi:hypothetical protein